MIRIAITGPESCGKTTLAKALSEHYKVMFVPEYSRVYLEQKKGNYHQIDLDKIAAGHHKNIVLSQNSINIIDSDFIVLKIWSQYKYGNVSPYITSLVDENLFDLHILCTPDIPWEEDPMRENEHDRIELFELYQKALKRTRKNYITVSGSHENRVNKSIAEISSLLK